MGSNISNKAIQLTVQGQTITSNFGTVDAAKYNLEQLLQAGVSNILFNDEKATLQKSETQLLNNLAKVSFAAFKKLKNNPNFLEYLSNVSPLQFYNKTNIGSRPAKRNVTQQLTLNDLRAIPFVGSWAQIKQNVTGYFGVGYAIQTIHKDGHFEDLQKVYNNSLFFRTLLNNSEMAMKKCYFPLTAFLQNDEKYAKIWTIIFKEFENSKKQVLKLSGHNILMQLSPVDAASIAMREKIVLPLLTIQQYAINQLRNKKTSETQNEHNLAFEKMIIRCSFGIINAARNSA